MESKIAHLEMIQGVINRLAQNSFLLKGWSVVLISALFALAAKDTHPLFVYLAYFPGIIFWVLDGFYLRQERLYRHLYDQVKELDEEMIDFSMDTSAHEESVETWFNVTRSKTLALFHGTLVGTIVIVMYIFISLAKGS